jgi:predicted DNA-binding transcriptional regulator AlpA
MVVSSASSKVSGGRIPGSRWASIVLPEPGDTCPSETCVRHTIEVSETLEVTEPRAETASGWAARVQGEAPSCACGCGARVTVKPQHRAVSNGLPRYVSGHHPNPLRLMYVHIEEGGLLTTGEVCARLGISESGYHRLEASGVFPSPRRWGKWPRPKMRIFSAQEVKRLRGILARRDPNDRGVLGRT